MYEHLITRCRELAAGSDKAIAQNLIALELFELIGVDRVEGAKILHKDGNPVKWELRKFTINFEVFVEKAEMVDDEALQQMAYLISRAHPWDNLVLCCGKCFEKRCHEDEEVLVTITRFFRGFGKKQMTSNQ